MKTCNDVNHLDLNDNFISYEDSNEITVFPLQEDNRSGGEMHDSKELKNHSKAETITSILEATRTIVLTEGINGINGLTVSRLEKESGRSRGTIYSYFQSLKGVLRTFFKTNDPWSAYRHQFAQLSEYEEDNSAIKRAIPILQTHLSNYINDPLAQKISMIELNSLTDDDILKDIATSREQLVQDLIKVSAPLFSDSSLDIRVIYALLLGGINYLSLHKNTLQNTFCEIDIQADQKAIHTAIEKVITWAYEEVRQEPFHPEN